MWGNGSQHLPSALASPQSTGSKPLPSRSPSQAGTPSSHVRGCTSKDHDPVGAFPQHPRPGPHGWLQPRQQPCKASVLRGSGATAQGQAVVVGAEHASGRQEGSARALPLSTAHTKGSGNTAHLGRSRLAGPGCQAPRAVWLQCPLPRKGTQRLGANQLRPRILVAMSPPGP